ncbi:MAG: hypothetical protein ACK5SE_06600 [Pseudanabaena sp.]
MSGVNDLDAATITLPGGNVQTQLDEKIDGPAIASSTDNAIVRWDGAGGRAAQNSTVTVSDLGAIAGATIDGDDNTVRDLALSAIKTVLADANEILRRDAAGVVVSGPATVDADGNLSGLKTITVRNDDDLSGASAHILRLDNHNNAPGSHPFVDFQRARAGNTNLQNGDEVGGLDFRPRFNGNTQTTAKIQVEYTGNGTTRLSDIVFQTSNGSTPAERMRIAADGKVTIAGDFEVQGTTTTINTTNLEVEDKNITVNFGGTDASAAGAGLTVEGAGGLDLAAIQYDATLGSKWKVGAIGGEDEIVTRTLSQTLTGKTLTSPVITNPTGLVKADVGLGNVDNTSDLNKPISTATQTALDLKANLVNPTFDDGITMLHESTPSNPSSGRIRVYPKSDNRLYTLDSSGVETVVGSGTAGGFVNYITNPDAESTTVTPWATYADAAAATPADGTGGSPNVTWTRNTSSPIRGNADFAFAKDAANRQGQGVAFAFTLATTDRSKKCQITFDYDTSAANYAAGDLRVYIYDVTNAALITPQTVAIPKGTNTFQTTFDTTTSTSYRLILHVATTNATAYTVDFDNFVVNAGQVVQGAAISEWQSYTPIVVSGWSGGTLGGRYRRVGSSMDIEISIVSPTTWSGNVEVQIPTGFTVDTNAIPAASPGERFPVGQAVFVDDSASTRYLGTVVYYTTTSVRIWSTGGADVWAPVAGKPVAGQNGADAIHLTFSVPIAEWAGNGTVNLGPGAQVEFAASTTGTWDAAATAGNTVYGPAGAPITGSLGANRLKVVRFQYPIQQDDVLFLEVRNPNGVWCPVENTLYTYNYQKNASFGARITEAVVGSTDVEVLFQQYGAAGSTYGTADATAINWSTSFATAWRVRKAKASAPVGYGLAGTDGSSGLYMAGRAPGQVTGATIASGMVGQETSVTFDFNTASAGIYSTSSGITLSPGVWLLDLSAVVSGASGLTAALGAISTDSGATSFSDPSFTTPNFFTGAANGTVFDPGVKVSFYLNTASSPTYYAKIYVTGANARARGRLRAVRIA